MSDGSVILTDVRNATLRQSVQTILRDHCPQYDALFVDGDTDVFAAIAARSAAPGRTIVILEADEPVDGGVRWSGVDMLLRIRTTLSKPGNAVPVILLSPMDGPSLAREFAHSSSIAQLPDVCIFIQKTELSEERLVAEIAKATSVDSLVVDNLMEQLRDEERSRISHSYRHTNIKSQMMGAARIVQGALLVADIEPALAASILGEFAHDDAAREQMVAYVSAMVEGGYIRPERSRRSRLSTNTLLIDDEHITNGWGRALEAIFSNGSQSDAIFAAVATIEDGLAYLEAAGPRRPLVLLDLILRSEATLKTDGVIEEAVRQGEANWRRLIEADRFLPILVFSKHGQDPVISRKLRDLELRYYWKDVPDDRDATRYYIKLCELVERVLTDAAIANDAEAARRIQQRLCGTPPNLLPQYDVAVGFSPCRAVGGDYYRVAVLPDGRILIVVADVMGKGLPAAMLAMEFSGATQVSATEFTSLDDLASSLNRFVFTQEGPRSGNAREPRKAHVTCFIGVLDASTSELSYVSAGHDPAIVVGASEPRTLESQGVAFGLFEQWPLAIHRKPDPAESVCGRVQLKSGDVIVVYTDGFNEARNAAGQEFGVDGIRDTVVAVREQPAAVIVEAVCHKVAEFSEVQSDDRAIVVLKVA
jgi:serine phosphatase RsbU (regulator of sigma subunit)